MIYCFLIFSVSLLNFITIIIFTKTQNLENSIDYSLIDNNLKEITVSSNKSPSLGITFAQKCQAITNLCKSKCGFDPNHKYSKNNRQKLMRYIKEYERIGLNQFIKNHKKKNYLEK